MTTVLRTTVGPYSAGTRVTVYDRNHGRALIRPWCHPDSAEPFEVDNDDLVERRDGRSKAERAEIAAQPPVSFLGDISILDHPGYSE